MFITPKRELNKKILREETCSTCWFYVRMARKCGLEGKKHKSIYSCDEIKDPTTTTCGVWQSDKRGYTVR